ncbi:MAG: hypothetical protein HYX75_22680 [Acidobacteria bacterium]|nr:hypothetical protein [Acidobacteriota bacterium]
MSERLHVRVNEELVLDAGICEEVACPEGRELLIHPPERTLFQQVLAYLKAKPDPIRPPSGSMAGREGVAAAALTLRWGSYLAVLLDRDKPLWPGVASESASRISDGEMARINIEASAALAEWIELYRAEGGGGGRVYTRLVDRAISYLPMPKKRAKLKSERFAALADTDTAARLVEAAGPARVTRARADAEQYPNRVLANALLNVAWRSGPVEDIHAGWARGYVLTHRRITPSEERELMRIASSRLALGMTVCLVFAREQPRRPWPEQVLPYGLAKMMLITPYNWTLTESSCEVRLPAWPL